MFNIRLPLLKNDAQERVAAAVKYEAPHWMVLIRNPGSKEWVPVRWDTKKIRQYNEFGDEVGSRPAVQAFKTQAEAEQWIAINIPEARREAPPTPGFFHANHDIYPTKRLGLSTSKV